MATTKQYQRWNHQTREYEDSVVYRISTGEAIRCYPIDAREMLASGEYSETPPTAEESAAAAEAAEDAAAEKAAEVKAAGEADEPEPLAADARAIPATPAAGPPVIQKPRRGRPPSKGKGN